MSFILTHMSGFGGVGDLFSFPTNWTSVNSFDHSDMPTDAAVYTGSLPSGVTIGSTFSSTRRTYLSKPGLGPTGNCFRHDTTGESGGGSAQSLYHQWYSFTPAYMTTNNLRPVGRIISYPYFSALGSPSKISSANTVGQLWRCRGSGASVLWIAIYRTVVGGDPQSQLGLFYSAIGTSAVPVLTIDITGYDAMNYVHKLEIYYSLNFNGGLKIIWDNAITTWYLGNFAAVQSSLADMEVYGTANMTSTAGDLNYFGGLGGCFTYKPA